MGIDPFTAVLAVVAIASSFAAASNQAQLADRQAENAAQMARLQVAELTRQQQEVNEAAQSDKGERARQADKEFASLVVSFAERGGLGTINALRGGQEVGFNSGLDLAKIEANRKGAIDSLQSRKKAASQGALNVATESEFTKKGAFLSALGSGISIAGTAYTNSQKINAAKKPVSTKGP